MAKGGSRWRFGTAGIPVTIVCMVLTAWGTWMMTRQAGVSDASETPQLLKLRREPGVAEAPPCPTVDCQCSECPAPVHDAQQSVSHTPKAYWPTGWAPSRFTLAPEAPESTQDSDWMPEPILPSLYASTYGKERFLEGGLKELELHTTPSSRWLQEARQAASTCRAPGEAGGAGGDGITMVTALLDLKRGDAAMGQFKRPFSYYVSSIQRLVDQGFPMVIFAPKSVSEAVAVKPDPSRVRWVHLDVARLASYFPWWDRVQAIRTSDLWTRQAAMIGYLDTAPQKQQEGYNPLVMSKMMLLRDAARLNPHSAKHLLFVDAAHMCAGNLRPGRMPVFDAHMNKGLMVTSWPYGSGTEVHGMADKALHVYMGTLDDPFTLVRGGVFGGAPHDIECAAKVYQWILWGTLADGYMGTEENALSLLLKHFPSRLANFDNNSLGNHGDNCASFQANDNALAGAGK